MLVHGVILSNVDADVSAHVYTQLAHHAVSAPAIKTNPLAATHHL
jgi:hypothetical protein